LRSFKSPAAATVVTCASLSRPAPTSRVRTRRLRAPSASRRAPGTRDPEPPPAGKPRCRKRPGTVEEGANIAYQQNPTGWQNPCSGCPEYRTMPSWQHVSGF
jgi:hypothetical protein